MNKISVCVPAYEMKGKGVEMLNSLLDSVFSQTYKNIEIIISDHSKTNDIQDFCLKNSKITYLRNKEKRGSSSVNINNAIQKATGDIIKPLFQDDFLTSDKSLNIMVGELLTSKKEWLVCTSRCIREDGKVLRDHTPSWKDEKSLGIGINTLGSPSCLIFKRQSPPILFDENLIWLMDCDFYYSFYKKNGLPHLFNLPCVTVREWSGTVTNTLATKEIRNKEEEYMKKKLGI